MQRDLVREITKELYTPMVQIEEALGCLEIVALNKDGKTMIQLVNGGGSHSNATCATDDYIPPVLDVRLALTTKTEPAKLILQPEGRELPFSYRNGVARVSVDRVDVHNIIEVVM